MALTPEQYTLRARAAAFAQHAQGRTNTKAAYAARLASLEDEVDPDRILSPEERARRVAWAMASQMAKLSLASSRARAKKRTERPAGSR